MTTNPSSFVALLRNKPVSHVWRGYGSAIFLELGELTSTTNRRGERGQPNGVATLMIEWSWRIERSKSILGGSWSAERRWPGMFRRILGSKVSKVEFFGALPEIAVSLSNGLRIVSFMTAEGQPEWAVIARKPALGSLCVKRGRLKVETPKVAAQQIAARDRAKRGA